MDTAVAKIKEKIDLAEYIGRSVPLKKAGRNFSGLCPFHQEKSPSFNVSPERGVFKCFGCGVSGDLFTFVMQRDGLTFQEALKMLADEAGVRLEKFASKKDSAEKSREDIYYDLHTSAVEYYHFLLTKHDIGLEAREYLEKRGIQIGEKDGVVEKFKIGYAPRSWDALGGYLLKKGFKQEDIVGCGLGVRSEKRTGFYDMFRGRVMFPLMNKAGQTVGFAGRVLGTDKTAKYINTAETPIFHKREFLFGFYQSKESIRRKNEAILVEGEMDMLSSFQAGIKNIVAVKGSVLTEEQVESLSRVCTKLLLCFDADFAGDKAMRKAIELAESKEMEIKVIQLKSGKDPDECIKSGVQNWIESIEKAVPYYDFLIQSAVKRHDVQDPFGKKRILEELAPYIPAIKNSIVRSHYMQMLSTLLDMPEKTLQNLFVSTKKIAPVEPKPAVVVRPKISQTVSSERGGQEIYSDKVRKMEWYFLALLLRLKHPVKGLDKKLEIEDIDDKKARMVYTLYTNFFILHPSSYIDDFLKQANNDEVLPVIDDIFLIDVPFEDDTELSRELFTTVKQLKELNLRERIRLTSLEIRKAEMAGNQDIDQAQLQKEISSLLERLGKLQRME